ESVLAPGESALAQLRLPDETLVLANDRFIVRQFSPVITIGGGMVVDPLARRPTLAHTGRGGVLETPRKGGGRGFPGAMTERATLGLTWEAIAARTSWTEHEAREAIRQQVASKRLMTVTDQPPILIPAKAFDRIQTQLLEKVAKFQKDNPLLPGITRE